MVSTSDGNDEVEMLAPFEAGNVENIFSTMARTDDHDYLSEFPVKENILRVPKHLNHLYSAKIPSKTRFTSVHFGHNSSLKSIGEGCFLNNTNLTKIRIPASVRKIGEEAFCFCSSLEEVTFEENSNLKEIGRAAFRGCKLKSIIIPSSLKIISGGTFWECAHLQSVRFEKPSCLEKISGALFIGCTSLQEVDIPSSVTAIGKHAFRLCSSLTNITFEEGSKLREIGQHAISDTSLESIKIPKSVHNIGYKAFGSCKHLKRIEFENRQTNIREHRHILHVDSSHLMEAVLDTGDCENILNLSALEFNEIDDLAKLIVQSERLQNSFNSQFCSTWTIFLLFLEFYVFFAIIVLYMIICDAFTNKQQKLNTEVWVLYGLLSFCLFREIIQFQKQRYHYFDFWNFLSLFKLCMILTSVQSINDILDHREERGLQVPRSIQYIILMTGFLVIFDLIMFLRISNRRFARFVVGLVQILSILGPFLLVTFLLLLAFAFIYHTQHGFEALADAKYNSKDEFQTLYASITTTLLFFAVEPERTDNYALDLAYGFIITVVLLNGVIIAVVDEEWNKGEDDIQYTFWKYRVYYLVDPFIYLINKQCTSVPKFFNYLNQFQNKNFFDHIKWYKDPYDKINSRFDENFETYKQLSHNDPKFEPNSEDPHNTSATIDIGGKEKIHIMTGNRSDLENNLKQLRSWQRDFYWIWKGKFTFAELFILAIQLSLHTSCVILGPFSLGLLWHERMRLAAFSHIINAEKDEDSNDKLHNKILNLERKILKMDSNFHDRIKNFETKIDAIQLSN